MVEIRGIGRHGGTHLGERRHDEPRRDAEPGQVAREAAQPIDDGLRLEHAVRDRERDEGVGVERDLELLAQLARERRIQERLPLELQLEVAPVAADREGPQQHRREEVVARVAPRREADREVHRFDAAHRAQFDALLRDLGRREPRVAQRQFVADQAREQRRLAGDELRQTARMRRGQLDAGARRVDETHERRASAHRLEFGDPAPPHRFGDVARDECGVAEAHSVGTRDVLRHGFGSQFVGGSVGPRVEDLVPVLVPIQPPHTDTLSRNPRNPRKHRRIRPGSGLRAVTRAGGVGRDRR